MCLVKSRSGRGVLFRAQEYFKQNIPALLRYYVCRYKSAGGSSCQNFYNDQALAKLLPVPKSRVINPVFRSSNNIGTPAHDFKDKITLYITLYV